MIPRISVVLNSYLRVRYLWEALESVVLQESNHGFEILLLSAVPSIQIPPELQRLANDRGRPLHLVRVPPGPVGVGLDRGVNEATGDYVALLDDDDLWEPGKILRLEAVLKNKSDLGYIHNSQLFVNEANSALGPLSIHRIVRHPSSLMPQGNTMLVDPARPQSIAEGQRYHPDFNNSSIVIQRRILLNRADILPQVRRGEDTFLYYLALLSGQSLYLTSDRLTRYRLHSAGSSAGVQPTMSKLSRRLGYLDFVSGHIESLMLVRDHASYNASPQIKRWLLQDLLFWQSLKSTVSCDTQWQETRDRNRVLLGFGVNRPRLRDILAASMNAAALVSPHLTKASFELWRRVW
jgi:glycosyltransferase involved in cell wall biosynthesis